MNTAIIVAAGRGKRMGAPLPKQFLDINGRPILAHTLDRFVKSQLFEEIIIVFAEGFENEIKTIIDEYDTKIVKTCVGGKERFHSVQNAINATNPSCEIVFIHDAVRPFVSQSLLDQCMQECKKRNSAIPCIPLKDSLRSIDISGTSKIENRNNYRAIQTPQVFNFKKLKTAYNCDYLSQFTDDASVYEYGGNKVHLIDGDANNFKITTPEDLQLAKYLLTP